MRDLKRSAGHVRMARRGTSREINRQIAVNLIRTRQPISRADLARLMGTTRGTVTVLVKELISAGLVAEGATGEAPRGRKPTFLYLDSRRRCVVAVDCGRRRCFLMVTDIMGEPLVGMTSFPTEPDPDRLVAVLADRIRDTLALHPELGRCEGIGVVVPGHGQSDERPRPLCPAARVARRRASGASRGGHWASGCH